VLLVLTTLAVGPAPSTAANGASPVLEDVPPSPTAAPVTDTQAEIDRLRAENADLAAVVATLTDERDRLLDVVNGFGDLYAPMEADRLLLSELRKELPPTRVEAEAYLQRLEQLALLSDPVRLASLAARVRDAAPSFLDWRETQFSTQEEAAAEFVRSGASAFQATLTEFRNAIMLTVANRLDSLLSRIERAR
jgi:hypothetical protein